MFYIRHLTKLSFEFEALAADCFVSHRRPLSLYVMPFLRKGRTDTQVLSSIVDVQTRFKVLCEVWGEHGEDLRPLLKMDPGTTRCPALCSAVWPRSGSTEQGKKRSGASSKCLGSRSLLKMFTTTVFAGNRPLVHRSMPRKKMRIAREILKYTYRRMSEEVE